MFDFKTKFSFENRCREASAVKAKYPDRVPVIVEKSKLSKQSSDIPDVDKHKYIVPKDLTIAQFLLVIRGRIKLKPEQAIFLFVNGDTLPPISKVMSEIYHKYKDEDGFLYVQYTGEACFGS